MTKSFTTLLTFAFLAISVQAQTWTKVSGIMDSSNIKGIGVINNQILVAGQNWNSVTQTDYAVSNDGGNTWSNLPTYQFAGYLPNALPQNNLMICSNGFTLSKKLEGSTWQSFSGANNFAEFSNGSIIGSIGSFPDTVYNFNSTGIRGSKLGNYTFKMGPKYCKGSNNRLFLFAYGAGLGYIDFSNLSTINIPSTLDGVPMSEFSWSAKYIADMIQTSNGDLFAVDAIGYGIFKSTDNGENWTTIFSQFGSNPSYLSIHKNSSDELFVLAGNAEIRRSTDFGITFTNITGNLPGLKKEFFVNTNNELFAFVSANGGIDPANSGIYKLTNINGIYDVAKNELPINLYPNPTNSYLNIEIENNSKAASAIITDILGKNILLENFSENKLQINVSNFNKGIYFITITCGNKRSTKKFNIN